MPQIALSSTRIKFERPFFPIGFVISSVVLIFSAKTDTFIWITFIACPIMYFAQFSWNQDVWLDGDQLIVKGLVRHEIIKINNIAAISEPGEMANIITIQLKSRSKFGARIKFYPKKKVFRQSKINDEVVETINYLQRQIASEY